MYMTKTLLNVRTDIKVKKEAQKIAKNLGVPLSVIVNAYLREFIRSKEVRFSYESKLRPEVGKILKKQKKDFEDGKNVLGSFASSEEMDAVLDA